MRILEVFLKKIVLLFPLANDASEDLVHMVYTGLGRNMKHRMTEAIAWVHDHAKDYTSQQWIFGAGTTYDFRHGPTLGSFAEKYTRDRLVLGTEPLTNQSDHHYYGSIEEIRWGVQAAERAGYQSEEVQFIFFGPWWHLLRVAVIWLLFFWWHWGMARFVPTHDEAQFKPFHEFKAWVRILLIRVGLVKGRDEAPYN